MDGGTAVYGYDGEGRRMKKTVGSETTYYLYGTPGLLCEFTTTNTAATTAASTDKTLYKTSDKLGSAVLVMTGSGTVIENNRTLPYGEAWMSDTASTNDKKFQTYLRDGESGLDYAGERYFAATAGRFASPDEGRASISTPQSLNRYAYVRNDPINHSDPGGRECTTSMTNGTLTVDCNYAVPPPIFISTMMIGYPSSFRWIIAELAEQQRERRAALSEQRWSQLKMGAPVTGDCRITAGFRGAGADHPRGEDHYGVDLAPTNADYDETEAVSMTDGTVTAAGVVDGVHYLNH